MPQNDHDCQPSVRLAQLGDLASIQDLYATCSPKDTVNLRIRSDSYLRQRITNGHAFLLPSQDKPSRIQAYGEAVVLRSAHDIRQFVSAELPKFDVVYRSQPGDTLVYFAGFLARPGVDGWSLQAIHFVECNFFARDSLVRRNWAASKEPELEKGVSVFNGPTANGSIGANGHGANRGFPSRIIWVCECLAESPAFRILDQIGGVFLTEANTLDPVKAYQARRLSKMANPIGGITHDQVIDEVPMGDGSGRVGSCKVLYFDRPLSPHQRARTRSNRHLITETEQRRLLNTRIGIIGLSTGSVALEALVREGVGGIYRLADFDHFELGNANRMLHGRDDVGQTKVDLCRRRIHSVDPSIKIEAWPEGVTDATVNDFVADCDIVVEECDDIAVKILVRQASRTAHVPLVMGTSQNGMIDVERYDIDREVQPFLRTEPIDMRQWQEASTPAAKTQALAKVVQSLFDYSQFSKRTMESMAQMGQPDSEVTSFPQLVEEVFLNSATVAHAARRILLGDATVSSGRYSIKMDQMFGPHLRIPIDPMQSPPFDDTSSSTSPLTSTTSWRPYVKNISLEEQIQQLLFIMDWARKAPNLTSEPGASSWHTRLAVEIDKAVVEIYMPAEVQQQGNDNCLRDYLTLGSMLENAEVAAAKLGVGLEIIDALDQSNVRIGIALATKKSAEKARLFPSLKIRTSGSQPWEQPLPPKLVALLTKELGVEIVNDRGRTDMLRTRANHIQGHEINTERVTTYLVIRDTSSVTRAAKQVEQGRLVRRVWLEMLHQRVGCASLGIVNENHEESPAEDSFILVPVGHMHTDL